MKTNEFDIEQPEDDKRLFRYMDKWKFDSIKESKFVFTNAKNQDDPYDCYNHHKKSGFVTVDNMERKFTFLSCWTLDDTYTEDKVLKYCRFRDKKDYCESAYVLETTYSKLIEFIKTKYVIEGLITVHTVPYKIRYGIVKYVEATTIKNTFCEDLHNSCFYKDKNNINKYQDENEFRIIANGGTSNENPNDLICIQGTPKDFLTNVYEFNKNTGEFREIGIPHVSCKTIKPSLFKPSKI